MDILEELTLDVLFHNMDEETLDEAFQEDIATVVKEVRDMLGQTYNIRVNIHIREKITTKTLYFVS